MKQIHLFIMMAISLILSGVLIDLGFNSTGAAFVLIFLLLVAVYLIKYLDSGVKAIDVDNRRKK